MPKKSSANMNIRGSETESMMPPSNLEPSLPSSNFASWEQAFQSAAKLVVPLDLGDVDTSPDASNATPTQQGSHTTNLMEAEESIGFRGDLKQVSMIAKLMSHEKQSKQKHSDSPLKQETTQCEKLKQADNNQQRSKRTHKENRKKRKLEECEVVKNEDDLKRRDEHKKRHKKEKRSKKKNRDTVDCGVIDDCSIKNTNVDNGIDVDAGNDQQHEKARKEDKKRHKKEKRSKKKKSNDMKCGKDDSSETIANVDDDIDIDSSSASPLEGQMVLHEGQTLFVLVDNKQGVVYSMERSESGKNIQIGKVEKGKIIIENKPKVDDRNDVAEFPFEVDPNDHCESPLVSYKDIKPLLDHLAKSSKTSLTIYDPFYCNGLVRDNLLQIGYSNVYNRKEDAYKTWDENDNSQPYPTYDVFITNPPYSGEHPERLIKHLTEDPRTNGKPWFLLMPQHIHKKDYYTKILATKKHKHNGIMPFYLVPKKRYVYLPPKDFREKKVSDVHKKSSPFVSMWYIWGGSEKMTEELMRAYENSAERNCELARSTSALRDLRRKKKSS